MRFRDQQFYCHSCGDITRAEDLTRNREDETWFWNEFCPCGSDNISELDAGLASEFCADIAHLLRTEEQVGPTAVKKVLKRLEAVWAYCEDQQ